MSQCNTLDIGSKSKYPVKEISNFASHSFVVDGIQCASVESFLQSLKFDNPILQVEVCKLMGVAAKKRGQDKNNWKLKQLLWWNGATYERESDSYQRLLDRVFIALTIQSPEFRQALIDTKDLILTNSIGKVREAETVLTQQEFCQRLMRLRNLLRKGVDLSTVTKL